MIGVHVGQAATQLGVSTHIGFGVCKTGRSHVVTGDLRRNVGRTHANQPGAGGLRPRAQTSP